jgi:hypothetical protein
MLHCSLLQSLLSNISRTRVLCVWYFIPMAMTSANHAASSRVANYTYPNARVIHRGAGKDAPENTLGMFVRVNQYVYLCMCVLLLLV